MKARDEKGARETLTHEREEEGRQEVEPCESGVKECSFVLEMRAGAERGRLGADSSDSGESLETSQLDR